MLLVLAFVCLAGALTMVAAMVTTPLRQRQEAIRRARSYDSAESSSSGESFRDGFSRKHAPALARLASRIDPRATDERIGHKLVASGLARRFSPTEFLAAKIVLCGIGVIFGIVVGVGNNLGGRTLPITIGLGAVGFLVLDFLLWTRTKDRRETIRRQLPDVLDVLAVSVEAGLSFDAAIAKLGEHMEGPLVEQFELVLSELGIGESRANALRRLADRIDLPEVTAVVTSIVQSEELGTPLGRILRTQATESRTRRRVAAEERAMKAPVKMIVPTGIFIFPCIFIVLIGPAALTIAQAFGN